VNKLIELLEKIQNPGRFSVSGKLAATQPGIKVQGVGVISLPFIEFQANQLIEQCVQAPFGRGEETVVDTNVRNVWQLSSEQIEFTNPDWNASLQKGVQSIAKQLGLQGREVKADLYKLLVYKEGSFFVPHRDTEKIPNMFATMVIHLPSQHEGGELIVSHGGESKSYSFADSHGFNPEFVAFYADCFHEIKPVTAGYRLCLIYNLAVTGQNQPPTFSKQTDIANNVGDYLDQWSKNTKASNGDDSFLAYLLEHSYTEENLSASNLKNGDFARASVLLNKASKNDCRAFLCLVSYYRLSYGDCYNSGYGQEADENDFEEYDVEEEKIYAHHFVSSDGVKISVNELSLDESQMLAKKSLLDGNEEVEISEATGNEGATKELWYHRAAVIIWPKRNDIEIAMKADTGYGSYYLDQYLKTHNAVEYNDTILMLAHHLVDRQTNYNSGNIVDNLVKIGDIDLLGKFICKQFKSSLNLIEIHDLIVIMDQFGWKTFAEKMGVIISEHSNSYRAQEVIPFLISLFVNNKLSIEGKQTVTQWFHIAWKSQSLWKSTLKKDVLESLLQSVVLVGDQSVANEVISCLSKRMTHIFLIKTYGPSLLKTWNVVKKTGNFHITVMNMFTQDILGRIQKDHSNAPNAPENWYRSGRLNCNCEFCKQVNAFLPNPALEGLNFKKTLKRNLTHLEKEISNANIDLSIKIDRDPPKFKGYCYKTQESFERELDLYKCAQKVKSEILQMVD
jgi:predicted 2-oxoglutarate/Fe(II)-dependent dioxygenase YbiX